MAELAIEVTRSILSIPAPQWDECVDDGYPFLRHAFLSALETSGSVDPERGWMTQHLLMYQHRELVAVLPLYIKQHSWGEYVFDQEWAAAYRRYGLAYYPKWVSSVPFSPVTGPRLCIKPSSLQFTDPEVIRAQVFSWLKSMLAPQSISGWHLLFCDQQEALAWQQHGAAVRVGCQFHWLNRGYTDFEQFLATFVARKRKSVNRERRLVREQGIHCERKTARQMRPEEWQQFYRFYAATYYKRGHQPHLTLDFFQSLARTMPDAVLVDWAYRSHQPIAAALFVRGQDTLYGRYWGCAHEISGLHFEVCFYRGIEYCIEQGLQRFDPGAQGEHKISRGFEPVQTYSCHWLDDPAFRTAIEAFLQQEQDYVEQYRQQAAQLLPFRESVRP